MKKYSVLFFACIAILISGCGAIKSMDGQTGRVDKSQQNDYKVLSIQGVPIQGNIHKLMRTFIAKGWSLNRNKKSKDGSIFLDGVFMGHDAQLGLMPVSPTDKNVVIAAVFIDGTHNYNSFERLKDNYFSEMHLSILGQYEEKYGTYIHQNDVAAEYIKNAFSAVVFYHYPGLQIYAVGVPKAHSWSGRTCIVYTNRAGMDSHAQYLLDEI